MLGSLLYPREHYSGLPNLQLQVLQMIDRDSHVRKVNILGTCLTLARVHYDHDNARQSEYYLRLAAEYFEELTHLDRWDHTSVAGKASLCG